MTDLLELLQPFIEAVYSKLTQRLPSLWYRRSLALPLLPLLPFSWLFRGVLGVRRVLYRYGFLSIQSLAVPLIVVGNLTAGGSGKTPLVLWLVQRLQEKGWRPGIISRGYGGSSEGVCLVTPDASPARVGDEPLLLARRSGVPVCIGKDRAAAGQALLAAHPECDIIVSDDGLQHLRLGRDVEIAVFDGRGAGNAQLLPAGPLRDPLARLAEVSAVVWNRSAAGESASLPVTLACPQFSMRLAGERFRSLNLPYRYCSASELSGQRLHALAGIGHPERFFAQLRALGLVFEPHPFPDHYVYRASDLAFGTGSVLLMTEKDAVKCAGLARCETWVLPVEAELSLAPNGQSLLDTILEKLNGRSLA